MAAGGSVRGSRGIMRQLRRMAKEIPQAVDLAVYKAGWITIMSPSLREVPVDFNILRKSHYVAPPQGRTGQKVVEIGYGTTYAAPVHERLDVQHTVGKAKFLSDPISRARPTLARTILEFAKKIAPKLGLPTRRDASGRFVGKVSVPAPKRPPIPAPTGERNRKKK